MIDKNSKYYLFLFMGIFFLFLSVLAEAGASERSKAIDASLDYMENASQEDETSTRMVEIVPVSQPPEMDSYDPDVFPPDMARHRDTLVLSPEHRMRRNIDEPRQQIVRKQLDDFDFSLRAGMGLRRDKFSWTIAGDTTGQNPDILSELIWEDLTIYEIGTQAQILWMDKVRLEGSVDYGWIVDGRNEDLDYAGDNRTGLFSKSHAETSGDNTLDASFNVGYEIPISVTEEWTDFLTNDLRVVALAGYSRREINLRDNQGVQDVPASGAFAGLNSTYQAVWKGPWIGFELKGERKKFSGFTRFEYHWAEYHAGADWNLRSDFQHPTSYTQDSDGTGYTLGFGGNLEFNEDWSLGLNIKYSNWKTDAGVTRFHLINGTVPQQQFNGAEWRSLGGMVSSTYHFSLGKSEPQENYAELK